MAGKSTLPSSASPVSMRNPGTNSSTDSAIVRVNTQINTATGALTTVWATDPTFNRETIDGGDWWIVSVDIDVLVDIRIEAA